MIYREYVFRYWKEVLLLGFVDMVVKELSGLTQMKPCNVVFSQTFVMNSLGLLDGILLTMLGWKSEFYISKSSNLT
jgi:hypothetical protein